MKRSGEARKQQSSAPKRKRTARSSARPAGGKTKRTSGEGAAQQRYWMRCPRCGMGLIESVNGTIGTERCTACAAVWADPEDVERRWDDGTPDLFKPFRPK